MIYTEKWYEDSKRLEIALISYLHNHGVERLVELLDRIDPRILEQPKKSA